MKYHWYQLNLSLNSGCIGTVKVFSKKLIQDGPWVFIDTFISSILQAALVFSWFLLLIVPVSLRYPCSHQSWYQSWTTYWSNTYWELPPPSSENKGNSHMWHLDLSKIVVLSKENCTKSSSNGHGGSVKACGHHSCLLNLEVPKPRPASSLYRCVDYPTMWPKTKP
jgi:hypothetical protein